MAEYAGYRPINADKYFVRPICASVRPKAASVRAGIEACATLSPKLKVLGHTVRLMPLPLKPYVKRHSNDSADAWTIREAVISG